MTPWKRVIREDLTNVPPVVLLSTFTGRLIPPNTGFRVRSLVLRRTGWRIDRTAMLSDVPRLSGTGALHTRLSIGANSYVNVGCHFDLSDLIRIGPAVHIAQEVMILTSSHEIGTLERRAGLVTTAPVRIERGAWIGARAMILAGVTVGSGAIVAAGAVVTRDVEPNTLVAGTPARLARHITP